jgi:hypothetical protein
MCSYCTNVYCCALGERIPLQNITNHLFILKNTILVLHQANYSPSKGVNFPLLSIYDKKKKKKNSSSDIMMNYNAQAISLTIKRGTNIAQI